MSISTFFKTADQIEVTIKLESTQGGLHGKDNAVINLEKNSTILDAMRLAAQNYDCFEYEGTNYGKMGCFITKICNVAYDAAKKLSWMVLVNGKFSPLGVSTCGLKNNDVVTFKYMNWTQVSHNSSGSCAFVGKADPKDTCNSHDAEPDQSLTGDYYHHF